MNKKNSKLFSPIKIKNFVFDNRFVLSPITLNASSYDGFASKEGLLIMLLKEIIVHA